MCQTRSTSVCGEGGALRAAPAPLPPPVFLIQHQKLSRGLTKSYTLWYWLWKTHPGGSPSSSTSASAKRIPLELLTILLVDVIMPSQSGYGCMGRIQVASVRFCAKREQLKDFKDFHLPESSLDWLICAIFARHRSERNLAENGEGYLADKNPPPPPRTTIGP